MDKFKSRSNNDQDLESMIIINDLPRSEYVDNMDGDERSMLDDTRSMKSFASARTNPMLGNGHVPGDDDSRGAPGTKSILKKGVVPSTQLKDALNSMKVNSAKAELEGVNDRYKRTRRYDTAGKYRIGPTFINKQKLAYLDSHKPAKLSVVPVDEIAFKSLEFGLLTYLGTFIDQYDKTEINLAFIQSLIDSGVDINCKDEHGQTPLHAMVRDWHPDVVLFAIRNNADVNAVDNYGVSPLHLAANINSVEMAEILCQNGANVDQTTNVEQQTPMHYAAKYNSLDTMKVLIKFQGNISQRDAKNRTVLFLAAEQGSTETAQFLLDIGVPAGIYDSESNSCISYLLEKMPHVAYRALHQFVCTNMSLKQSDMYLKHLENNPKGENRKQKSPLEIITIYDDTEIIMHPVIQKAIDIKWEKFGRVDTIRKLFITLIYLVCWLVLAYTFKDDNTFYRPWSQQGWKIAFEILIVAFAVYFFYKDVAIKRDAIKHHSEWTEWKLQTIRSNHSACHPAWPGDRQNLEAEMERIKTVPSLVSKQKAWFAYEWFMLIMLAAIIVTRILTMSIDNIELYVAHKCVFGAGLIFSFLRILKVLNRFQFFAVFLKMSSLVLVTTVQVFLLYIQLYIPFVAVFWLSFGNKEVLDQIAKVDLNTVPTDHWTHIKNNTDSLVSLNNIFYNVYSSSFGQGLLGDLVVLKKTEAQVLITLFQIFVTFILFSVFVALITSKFTTHYFRVVAEASLLRASIVLQLEKNLSKRDKMNLHKFYRDHCNPLVVPTEAYTETILKRNALSQLRLAERRLNGIENIVSEAESRFLQNDSKSHLSIMDSLLGRIGLLYKQEEEYGQGLKTTLNDLAKKQGYMNRCLPKLLKPSS